MFLTVLRFHLTVRDTLVLWVIEDEIIPTVDEFWSKQHKISSAILRQGHRGNVTIEGHVVNPKFPKEYFWEAYQGHGISIGLNPGGEFFFLNRLFSLYI